MNVWILVGHGEFGMEEILGVYSSVEAATEAELEWEQKDHDFEGIDVHNFNVED